MISTASSPATFGPTRYVVSATLVTCSPLAIHTGLGSDDLVAIGRMSGDKPFRKGNKDLGIDALNSVDHLIARDHQNLPYIPGSSLKGVLREYLSRSTDDANLVEWLLGEETPRALDDLDDEDAAGDGGAVIVEDGFIDAVGTGMHFADHNPMVARLHTDWFNALRNGKPSTKLSRDYASGGLPIAGSFSHHGWRGKLEPISLLRSTEHLPFWDGQELSYVEHRVVIDRRRGAADEHKLFTSEVVPAGLPFRITFIVPHAALALEGVQLLVQALAGFNLEFEHAPIQLGSGGQHGWGLMACLFKSVRVQTWRPDGRLSDIDPSLLDMTTLWSLSLNKPRAHRRSRIAMQLRLRFSGSFGVADPAKSSSVAAVETGILTSGENEQKSPDFVPRAAQACIEKREEKSLLMARPLLPATGFKGPVRSQIERILRTLHSDIAVSPFGQLQAIDQQACPLAKQLFGFDGQRSGIWCTDFVGVDQDLLKDGHREMVAIDRFTGGASDHAKYDAILFFRPELQGVLCFDLPHDHLVAQQVLGAIALMIRDLIEGDISFGMGHSKGFGACEAIIEAIKIQLGPRDAQAMHQLLPSLDIASLASDRINVAIEEVVASMRSSQPTAHQSGLIAPFNQAINLWLSAVRDLAASVAALA